MLFSCLINWFFKEKMFSFGLLKENEQVGKIRASIKTFNEKTPLKIKVYLVSYLKSLVWKSTKQKFCDEKKECEIFYLYVKKCILHKYFNLHRMR